MTASPPASSARLSLVFTCIGHTYIHLFTAFYFVIVLALEADWGLPYHELIELWTLGALLVGLGALPAGWLGDRWSAQGMMVVFYLGMGASSIFCGLASGPAEMLIGLSGIGLFAAIYHPVGIAWLVRNTREHRGKVLSINGIFGSIGVALAAAVAGVLIDLSGWRAAFIVPGAVSIVTGGVLLYLVRRGLIAGGAGDGGNGPTHQPASRSDMLRGFTVLVLTMFLAGIIYQSTQVALPKVFAERLGGIVGEGTLGVGMMVALVYGAAGIMQLIGGHLADRYPLKPVYLGFFIMQVPLLWLTAGLAGLPLVGVALLAVVSGVGLLPAENMLLARFAPQKHHGLAFGVKFVLAFCAAPLGVVFVSFIHERTGGLYWLFIAMTLIAAICMVAAMLLPGDRRAVPVVSPAE